MADEYTHHISHVSHGLEHTGVEVRTADRLVKVSETVSRLNELVLRKSHVEEGKCIYRCTTVCGSVLCALINVPLDLVALEPSVIAEILL